MPKAMRSRTEAMTSKINEDWINLTIIKDEHIIFKSSICTRELEEIKDIISSFTYKDKYAVLGGDIPDLPYIKGY